MSISFKVEDVSISAKRDRAMFNTFAGNRSYVIQGVGDELAVASSSSSFVVTLGTGEAVICGGSMLSEGSASTLTLQENQSGYIVIRVDLSQTGDNICRFMNVASLVQENINDDGLVYDLPLYQYSTNGSGVSSITDRREIINSSLSFVPAPTYDTGLSTTSTNAVQNRVVTTQLNNKAPTNHAATHTGYGVGTPSDYGHVKTINDLNQSSFSSGNALSAYQGYVLNRRITLLDDNKAESNHSHGSILSNGDILVNGNIRNGDRLVINDETNSQLINSSITFDGTTATSLLSQKGTWTTAQTLFQILFPVGSIYATYTNTNPNTFIGGTWTLLNSSGKVDVNGTVKGNRKTLGLFDGTQKVGLASSSSSDTYNGGIHAVVGYNVFNKDNDTTSYSDGFTTPSNSYRGLGVTTNVEQSGLVTETVTCYLWRRTR